jgi:hypothetical protein
MSSRGKITKRGRKDRHTRKVAEKGRSENKK